MSQLQREILSADQIDILCSFIKWSGIRILVDPLRLFVARNGTRLRVITTSYMGATDVKAVEFLQNLPNAELKVSYDTHRTRLHAKAYLFHRRTRFGTAYIGSANLSHAALTEGLEWNVKVSEYEQPHPWEKVTATFETYWNDAEFETYGPADRGRLEQALQSERRGDSAGQIVCVFDLQPYPFQKEILDRIQAEREVQGRRRHLIVAATGTGKTIIAAFDFRRWRDAQIAGGLGREPRLLFVAHREEILRQSLATFRGVLRDQNYGGLLVGGQRPPSLDQLFISIQSYNSQGLADRLAAEHYDYAVIDEFHHAAAPSYQDLLSHIQPKCLLGLTATPERADSLDVLSFFGGHITAEIRLPDAVSRKLLSPFQYFCITDSVDPDGLQWQRGGYRVSDLQKVYTGNDLRARLVIEKVQETLLDGRQARGLGFCVSMAHAEYMAGKFSEAGIPAAALTAESPDETRLAVQGRLRRREINFVFVVDLYNEGVDIPEVDTVLFLRPTESLTVYLQQLGRGLRLTDDKECLTVLDFVGRPHRNFRFDMRFRALLSDRSRRLDEEIEQGFPHLPAGCSIQMERVARQYVLDNIRQNLRLARPQMVQRIAQFSSDTGQELTLANFLSFYDLEPDGIYRRATWSRLCAEARVRPDFHDPDERQLTRGLRRVEHINDPVGIARLRELVGAAAPPGDLSETDRRRLLMLHLSLWDSDDLPSSLQAGLDRLRANPAMSQDLLDLLEIRLDSIQSVSPPLDLPFCCPLHLHSLYTRDEILAALGHWTLDDRPAMREGVLHLPKIRADVFLVTLNKAEKEYSPTTMYDDYAINDTLFHWQSQSTTSATSPTGRRYIEQERLGQTVLLFVRADKRTNGLACPYHFLGPATYVTHDGSRPMNITWRLRHPMAAHLLRTTRRLATA